MGIYVNPDNASFRKAVESQIYIDKSGILKILNDISGCSTIAMALILVLWQRLWNRFMQRQHLFYNIMMRIL